MHLEEHNRLEIVFYKVNNSTFWRDRTSNNVRIILADVRAHNVGMITYIYWACDPTPLNDYHDKMVTSPMGIENTSQPL
jgi:hypothetical protein